MASKATAPKYVVNQPFDRTDERTGRTFHFEPGDDWPADHPDTENIPRVAAHRPGSRRV